MSMFETLAPLGFGAMMGMNSRSKDYQHSTQLAEHNAKLNKDLAGFYKGLNLQFWKDTNAPAQVEQLKKAGLNPALMYKQGGAGGQTVSHSGNAQQGNNPNQPHLMGIGLQQMGAIQDAKLKEAQAKVLEEDAKSKEMDNDVKERVGKNADFYEAENRIYKALQDAHFLYGDKGDGILNLESNYGKIISSEATLKEMEARLQKETNNDQIETVRQNLVNLGIDAEAKRQGIELSKQQERRLYHQIITDYINAGMKGLDVIIKGRFKDIGSKIPNGKNMTPKQIEKMINQHNGG
jgi:hypothetical protein